MNQNQIKLEKKLFNFKVRECIYMENKTLTQERRKRPKKTQLLK